MGMCRNWRSWAVVGGAAMVIALAAPGLRTTLLPLLLVAACPLSMLLMGVGMASAGRRGSDRNAATGAPSEEELVR